EIWLELCARDNGFHKVGDRMHKGMLVANDMAGRPPISDIRVVRFRNNDVAKSARLVGISRIVKAQSIHFLPIEAKRTAAAVDFKCELIFAAAGKARRFEI